MKTWGQLTEAEQNIRRERLFEELALRVGEAGAGRIMFDVRKNFWQRTTLILKSVRTGRELARITLEQDDPPVWTVHGVPGFNTVDDPVGVVMMLIAMGD